MTSRAILIREMLRVLRPGGRAVIVVWKKVATLRLMQEITQRLRAALPQASATEAADEAQSEATARMVYRLGDPDELTKQLNAAGFTNDQIVSMSPFEAEWTGIEPTDEVVGMMLDKPGVKASYAPEQRDRAAAIVKEWFQTATWDNISLIALLKK
jgi:SAM-dependent methyltransferase